MPIVTEEVESTASATNAVAIVRDLAVSSTGSGTEATAAEPYLAVTSTATAVDTASLGPIGYNATSSGAASSSPTPTTDVRSANFTSSAAVTNGVAIRLDVALETEAAAASTPDVSVDSFETSSATASSTPEVIPYRNLSLSSSASATSTPSIDVVVEVESTAVAVNSLAFERTLSVGSTATATEARAPSASTIEALESSGLAVATTAAQLVAHADIVSSAVARSREVIDDGIVLWTNTKLMATATWSAQPFNSYVVHEGVLLAAGVDGVYAFGADTDAGEKIAALVRGDLTDLGSAKVKTMDRAFVNGRCTAPITLTVATEDGEWQYDSETVSERFTNIPIDLGRGLYSRHVRFALANQGGTFFSIRDVTVRVAESTRMR